MIALIGAELHRLRVRRMTLVVGLALVAGLGLLLFATNVSVTPPSAAEVASAQASYEQDRADILDACLAGGQTQDVCEQNLPTIDDYLRPVTSFRDAGGTGVLFGTFFAMLAGYLLAASAIGAEFATGAIANWLTFVPQRLRVLGSKLAAVVVVAAAIGVLTTAIVVAGTALLVTLHDGTVSGVGPLASTAGRAVVLVVIAALLGFSFALLTRHTGAAVGIVLGYLVASTVLSGLTLVLPALADLPRWLPDRNVLAFLNHGTTFYSFAGGGDSEPVEKTISFAHSATYWAALVVVVVAASAAVFRRRDVT